LKLKRAELTSIGGEQLQNFLNQKEEYTGELANSTSSDPLRAGGGVMKTYAVIFLVLSMVLACAITTEASWQLGLDWQVTEEIGPQTVKLNWWLTPRCGVRSLYSWTEEEAGLAFIYLPQKQAAYNSYLGLGVRDVMGTSQLPLKEKIELTAGLEWRLDWMVQGFSTALEYRLITANLVGEPNQLTPFFGLSLNYGFTPAAHQRQHKVDNADLYLLAKLIRAEAEGEPYRGQVAVGAVVMNRVKSKQFPNTIYDVIYQPRQFSCLPKLDTIEPNAESLQAARDVLAGKDPSRGALYYYNPKLASREGARFFKTAGLKRTIIIGNHQFFK
jgi:hypothetical protein